MKFESIVAAYINHVWTYDFLFDSLANGRKLKILTVVDEYSRFCLTIQIGISITSAVVINTLELLFSQFGSPKFIRSDNGPEFIAKLPAGFPIKAAKLFI